MAYVARGTYNRNPIPHFTVFLLNSTSELLLAQSDINEISVYTTLLEPKILLTLFTGQLQQSELSRNLMLTGP
jgi:hypothetical protein